MFRTPFPVSAREGRPNWAGRILDPGGPSRSRVGGGREPAPSGTSGYSDRYSTRLVLAFAPAMIVRTKYTPRVAFAPASFRPSQLAVY